MQSCARAGSCEGARASPSGLRGGSPGSRCCQLFAWASISADGFGGGIHSGCYGRHHAHLAFTTRGAFCCTVCTEEALAGCKEVMLIGYNMMQVVMLDIKPFCHLIIFVCTHGIRMQRHCVVGLAWFPHQNHPVLAPSIACPHSITLLRLFKGRQLLIFLGNLLPGHVSAEFAFALHACWLSFWAHRLRKDLPLHLDYNIALWRHTCV